jgi:hypothetical protein
MNIPGMATIGCQWIGLGSFGTGVVMRRVQHGGSERNSIIENRNYEKVKEASRIFLAPRIDTLLRNMLYVLVPARDCREGVTCRDSFFLSIDGYRRGTRAPRQKKRDMLTGAQHLQVSIVQFYTKALF